jgi:hypothetical protein
MAQWVYSRQVAASVGARLRAVRESGLMAGKHGKADVYVFTFASMAATCKSANGSCCDGGRGAVVRYANGMRSAQTGHGRCGKETWWCLCKQRMFCVQEPAKIEKLCLGCERSSNGSATRACRSCLLCAAVSFLLTVALQSRMVDVMIRNARGLFPWRARTAHGPARNSAEVAHENNSVETAALVASNRRRTALSSHAPSTAALPRLADA